MKFRHLLATALLFYVAVASAYSCAHVTPVPSAPTIRVRHMTENVISDWPGFEDAVDAARDEIVAEFPGHPELLDFVIDVWAANDHMFAISCIDTPAQKYPGCTDRDCSVQWGFACTWRVSVRQTLSQKSGPDHAPVFSGDIRPANEGALFWEIADRLVPARMGLPSADLATAHTNPDNVARRERMQARYSQIAASRVRSRP